MKFKSTKLTYKTLFTYSLVVITLLLVAVPVLANTTSGSNLLAFEFNSRAGSTPNSARTLVTGINLSHLEPGQEDWYLLNRAEFNSLDWVSLAMRYQTDVPVDTTQINFQVLTKAQPTTLMQGPSNPNLLVGEGLRSPVQAHFSESLWTGQVASDKMYYIRVFNRADIPLDYTIEARVEQPTVSGATPASLPATGGLASPANARQLAWTLTAQAVEHMTAAEATRWMREAQAVGWIVTAGSEANAPLPSKANPAQLWELTAQAIAGQDAETASQWLIQADSLGWLSIPLNAPANLPPIVPVDPNPNPPQRTGGDDGSNDEPPPSVPAEPEPVETYAPINVYPNNPLAFNFDYVNSGRLGPYGEHWYSFTRDDLDDVLIEDAALTMFFTPRQGYISDRVNFEIFPASQYHIWARGDADYMEHFGSGQWVSRDEDSDTGERLWAGTLMDKDRYLVKVKNGTPDVVDYYLFPDDVENAELGNPTLHHDDGSMTQTPYAPVPPTRPGPPPEPGESPAMAIPLSTGKTDAILEPGEVRWYRFSYGHTYSEPKSEQHFTIYMTNTPLDAVRARHANFAIYPGAQYHLWARGTEEAMAPMGTSAPSPYPLEDSKSLQVLWDGYLMEAHTYYIKVTNYDIGSLTYELDVQGTP